MLVTHCTLAPGLEDKVPVRGSVGADITLCLAVLYSSMKTAAWLSPSDIISPHSDTSYLVSSILHRAAAGAGLATQLKPWPELLFNYPESAGTKKWPRVHTARWAQ